MYIESLMQLHIPLSEVGSRGHERLCSFSTAPMHAVAHCPPHHSGYDGTHRTVHDPRGVHWGPTFKVVHYT